MTQKRRNILLVVAMVLLLGSLLSATLVGNAEIDAQEKCFMHLSGFSSGATRKNNLDGSDTAAISASALYVTLANNNLPYVSGDWENYRYYPTSNSVVKLDGTSVGGTLIKYNATSYYLEWGRSATTGSKLVVDGVFKSGSNSVNVSPALFVFDGEKWSQVRPTFTYFANGKETDNLFVLPGSASGSITAKCNGADAKISFPSGAVQNGKFALRNGETRSVYKVTVTGTYQGVQFEDYVNVTVGYDTFAMKNGAAVALFDGGGLRFGATISAKEHDILVENGYKFRCALAKRSEFDKFVTDGQVTYSALTQAGAIFVNCKDADTTTDQHTLIANFTGIAQSDFATDFVGVVFADNGFNRIFADFYQNDVENNTRSCYRVAQLCEEANDNVSTVNGLYVSPVGSLTAKLVVRTVVFGNGTPQESVYSTTEHAVGTIVTVDAPETNGTLVGESQVQQKIYARSENVVVFEYIDKNVSSVGISAWFLPYLSAENGYMNDKNFQIVAAMKAAGLNTVLLNSMCLDNITSQDDVESIRQLIALFDSYGISSYVDLKKQYFALDEYPDFSDCSGFKGIMQWDEPNVETIDGVIAAYAKQFDDIYGDDAEFWCNLLPSEAVDGAFGQIDGTNATYAQYLERYCTSVLSQISKGTKIISVDSYPIYADQSIDENFLTSIGLLKYYAMEYGAKANICLQSCGWNEGSDAKARMPSEAEMRLQVYAALAFGMDSISWFTYSNFQSSDLQTADMVPVDYLTGSQSEGYTALSNVNKELLAFADVYAGFDWQGTIFNFGFSSDEKSGYTKLSETAFSKYELSASDTQFDSISVKNSGILSTQSVLTGVFKSKTDSNERAYAFCNYDSLEDGGKTATVTLKSDQKLLLTIYRNGTVQTVTLDGSYELTLDGGEGCFITCAPA